MYEVSSGALMVCCFVAGLFFYKFWRQSQDKLFMLFSFSFFLLSFERFVLGYIGAKNEPSPFVYLIRLGAFILIIFAIINKNKDSSNAGNT